MSVEEDMLASLGSSNQPHLTPGTYVVTPSISCVYSGRISIWSLLGQMVDINLVIDQSSFILYMRNTVDCLILNIVIDTGNGTSHKS